MDTAKNNIEKEANVLNDSDLEQVSGGLNNYWVPGGHDAYERYVRCPYCPAVNGKYHEFWTSSYGKTEAECQKKYPYKKFNIFAHQIDLSGGYPYTENRR